MGDELYPIQTPERCARCGASDCVLAYGEGGEPEPICRACVRQQMHGGPGDRVPCAACGKERSKVFGPMHWKPPGLGVAVLFMLCKYCVRKYNGTVDEQREIRSAVELRLSPPCGTA